MAARLSAQTLDLWREVAGEGAILVDPDNRGASEGSGVQLLSESPERDQIDRACLEGVLPNFRGRRQPGKPFLVYAGGAPWTGLNLRESFKKESIVDSRVVETGSSESKLVPHNRSGQRNRNPRRR